MSGRSFINGEFFKPSEGKLSLNDFGIQRGYAVFDYIRTYNRKLFHPLRHVQRFRRSGAELRISLNLTDSEILDIADQLIEESDLTNPAVRLLLTAGQPDQSYNFPNSNFIAIAEELQDYGTEIYEKGAGLSAFEFRRELPEVKSTNYLNAVRLEPWRRKIGVFDILYHTAGEITECPRSNFFAFFDDVLVTPGKEILKGITRNCVIDLARSHFKVEESIMELSSLKSMTEAFVTSTSKKIVPVVSIDGISLGNGKVGARTRKLMTLFDDYTSKWG